MKEKFRIKVDGERQKGDHVTMFLLHLPLAVFSFSVKLSSFAFDGSESFAPFSSMYSFFQENVNANFTFVVCSKHF